MKKVILIFVLIFSTFDMSNASAANEDYDHNELLDYPGYGEAMYESIVEQTSFISGRYTENKEYVNESINTITDYAKSWWNEYETISNMPPKEKMREMLNAAGGYVLTVGDFIKNLFNKFFDDNPDLAEIDYSGFEVALELSGQSLKVKSGYSASVLRPNGSTSSIGASKTFGMSLSAYTIGSSPYYFYRFQSGGGYLDQQPRVYGTLAEVNAKIAEHNAKYSSVSSAISLLTQHGYKVEVFEASTNQPVVIDGKPNNFNNFIRHIRDNSPQMVVPQPKAYLSCPDGTRINMTVNGGTFLDVKGQVMQVSKDGTATVSSQICNLAWEKPKIQYIDGTDQVGISTPDGKTIDAETGEKIIGEGEIDDSLEGCDGVLCGIGKLLSGLASIAKSIAGLAGKILDGLLGLFVPDDLAFVSEEFDKLTSKFNDKLSILTALKDTIFGVFKSNNTGNPFSEINMSLPAAPGFSFNLLDAVTFVEPYVPRIKQVISGIIFLMTIMYVYRKITGSGGVMEK